ncbi:MAG: acyl-[acyl-carrier-protein]--UDP-N-acetylglucosamine O-acyltransferase [Pirellulaceae bacterium]|nr:MAG: acyl-[acyl-carrier-protein]--UDP-N-acetylglucosamine O-acyltransferase [Pirellulaceae bacterium]
MATIHPTALVSPRAHLGAGVYIGPFAIVEDDVLIGDGCRIEARATIKSGTVMGPDNHVFEGACLGGYPQHLRAGPVIGGVRIGARNQIREFVTIHRAVTPGANTEVGDDNMIMVGVHIAHDCRIGNHTIMANAVLLAGHVEVQDRAYLSGAVAVHQFCRIGRCAMVGGQSHITRDVPPYVTVDGETSRVVGLNLIGLKRAGYTAEQIVQLKQAYRLIYRSDKPWLTILSELRRLFADGPAAEYNVFFASCSRGIVPERRRMPAMLRIADFRDDTDQDHSERLAG